MRITMLLLSKSTQQIYSPKEARDIVESARNISSAMELPAKVVKSSKPGVLSQAMIDKIRAKERSMPQEGFRRVNLVRFLKKELGIGNNTLENAGGILHQLLENGIFTRVENGGHIRYIYNKVEQSSLN